MVNNDPFEVRWELWREIHSLSAPGAVRDILWKSKALVSLTKYRVGKTKFISLAVGLLGLGDLIRGSERALPLLEKMMRNLEVMLQPAVVENEERKVDLREFIGGLYIYEFSNSHTRPLQLLKVLFDLFDPTSRGWMTRNDCLRLLLLIATNVDLAHQLSKISVDICDTNTKITFQYFENYFKKEKGIKLFFEKAFQSCMPKEYLFSMDHEKEMNKLNQKLKKIWIVERNARELEKQLAFGRKVFLCLHQYSKNKKIKRLAKSYAFRFYKRKNCLHALYRLKSRAYFRKHQFKPKLVLAINHHERKLKIYSFKRLKALHEYHFVKRDFIQKEKIRMFNLGFEKLDVVLKERERRILHSKMEYSFWLWRNINLKVNQKIQKADYQYRRTCTKKWMTIWSENVIGIRKHKQHLEMKEEFQQYFGSLMSEANFTVNKIKSEQEREDLERKEELEKEKRITQKYRKTNFFKAQDLLDEKKRNLEVIQKQTQERRERRKLEMEEIERQVEEARKEIRKTERRNLMEKISRTMQEEMKIDAKTILSAMKTPPQYEYMIFQEDILEKYDGNIDLYEENEIFNTKRLRLASYLDQKSFFKKIVLVDVKGNARDSYQHLDPQSTSKEMIIDSCCTWQLAEKEFESLIPSVIIPRVEKLRIDLHQKYAAEKLQQFYRSLKCKRKFAQVVKEATFRKQTNCAITIQKCWRTHKSWEIFVDKVTQTFSKQFDPYNNNQVYYINLLNGTSSIELPVKIFTKFGKQLEDTQSKVNNPWVVFYDRQSCRFFYHNTLTDSKTWNPPLGYPICTNCQANFSERNCKDCRYVEKGEVTTPSYCIPCWVLAHLDHEFML